jgi:nicotinamidase-related amidase
MTRVKGPDLSRAVVVNVDVQRAFGAEADSEKLRGLRPTEGQEIAQSAALSKAVHQAGGTVVVTKDWHNEPGTKLPDGQIDDRAKEEFGIYGKHAVAGTADAELNAPLERVVRELEAQEGVARTIVPVDRFDETGRAGAARVIEVHKNVYDVTKRADLDGKIKPNASFIDVIARAQEKGADTVLITGKIAEVCVRAAAESIRDLFPLMKVIVVDDAVSALPAEVAKSIGLESKEEVIASLKKKGVEAMALDRLLPPAAFIADGVLGR